MESRTLVYEGFLRKSPPEKKMGNNKVRNVLIIGTKKGGTFQVADKILSPTFYS